MGCHNSIETFKTYTTPGYKPKPQRTRTSQPQMLFVDSVRTITTPGYKPKCKHMQPVAAATPRNEKVFSLSGKDFTMMDAVDAIMVLAEEGVIDVGQEGAS